MRPDDLGTGGRARGDARYARGWAIRYTLRGMTQVQRYGGWMPPATPSYSLAFRLVGRTLNKPWSTSHAQPLHGGP